MRVRTPRDLGALIRENRRSLGISQLELATRVGVGREWLIAVEKGKANAGIARLLRVLTVLRMDVDIRTAQESSDREATAKVGLANHIARLVRKRAP